MKDNQDTASPAMNTTTPAPAQDAIVEQWNRRSYVTAAGAAPATTPYPAAAILGQAESDARRTAVRQIVLGTILMVVGVGVTVATYTAAEAGGHYMLAWGPVVFGFISLMRGLTALGQK